MKRGTMAMIVAALLASAGAAEAQWSTLPNGELGYAFNYSTHGVFSCLTSNIRIGSCTATGNSVTLERDGATMTMSYTGVSSAAGATNISQTLSLGTISTVFGGTGPFLAPSMRNPIFVLTALSVTVDHDIPGASSHGFCRPMSPREVGLVSYGSRYGCSSHLSLPLPETPGPADYPLLVFDRITFPVIGYEDGTYEYTATVGVIPEPGTVALLATGLVGLAGVAGRRRRR